MEEEKNLYLLTDLQPKTVGLVQQGAVGVFGEGQNFFMLKQKNGGNMANSNILEWVRNLAKSAGEDVPEEVESLLAEESDNTEETTEPTEQTPEPAQPEQPTEPAPTPAPEPTQKSQDTEAVIGVMKAQIDTVTKQYQMVNQELEKARAELAEEKKLRESEAVAKAQKGFVDLAKGMVNLVTNPDLVGKALHWCSANEMPEELFKALESTFDRGEKLLKASNMWTELGSTAIDENDGTPLAKAQKMVVEKGITLEEAILSLPQADQVAILQESRGGVQ